MREARFGEEEDARRFAARGCSVGEIDLRTDQRDRGGLVVSCRGESLAVHDSEERAFARARFAISFSFH